MRTISATERENAELAIRHVFQAGCEAWNRGDLDGYLASYWDSDQTIWISSGNLTRGREAIIAAYKARFSTPQAMGTINITELEIDILTPTDAVAFGHWRLVLNNNESSEGYFTVQLRKLGGTWFYVSDHSSTAKMSRSGRSEP